MNYHSEGGRGLREAEKGELMAGIITTIINVRAVLDGKVRGCNLRISEGRIQGILPPGDAYGRVIDGHGMLGIPGLIDAHFQGAMGLSFGTVTEAREVRLIRDFCVSHGITSFLPTIPAGPEEDMLEAAAAIGSAKKQLNCPQIAGIHLEGPFLAEGWQEQGTAKEYLRQPSYALFRRIQDISGGIVTRVTLSPELPGASELTRRLTSDGVRVFLGHSGATYEQAMECIKAGAMGVTHIFHRTAPMTSEEPGLVAAALEQQELFCEVLCDSIPTPLLRLLLATKGVSRTCAATGCIFPAGQPEGLYQVGDRSAVLRGDQLTFLDDGQQAGSVCTAENGLLHLSQATGLSFAQCLPLFSSSPARMLGLSHRKGSLEVGKDADIVFLDKGNRVRMTICQGNIVYDSAG